MKLSTSALLFVLASKSVTSFAADSVHHSGQGSKHSVLAAGHGAASSAKVASAVVAVPVIAAGSVILTAGAASAYTGASIAEVASTHKHHRPLVITETTITADPAPNKVIVIQNKQRLVHTH